MGERTPHTSDEQPDERTLHERFITALDDLKAAMNEEDEAERQLADLQRKVAQLEDEIRTGYIEARRMRTQLLREELTSRGLDVCTHSHAHEITPNVISADDETMRMLGMFPADAIGLYATGRAEDSDIVSVRLEKVCPDCLSRNPRSHHAIEFGQRDWTFTMVPVRQEGDMYVVYGGIEIAPYVAEKALEYIRDHDERLYEVFGIEGNDIIHY